MRTKKSMRKVLTLLVALVMCACFAVACGGNPDPAPTPEPTPDPAQAASIVLDKTEVSIELHESYTLTAATENVTGAIAWTSSDESVATVDGGKIKTLKEGKTTVTAKADGAEATCAVTVFDGGTAPVLEIETTSVGVDKGGKYAFDVAALWKGNAIEDENIEYTWRLSDGATEGIAAVTTRADGKAEVEGIEYGDTEWTVSASVYGHNLAGSVAIKVVDSSVNFRAGENVKNAENGFKIDLSLSGFKGLTTTAINVDIYNEDVKSDDTLTWTQVDGEEYVGYEGGVLTAIAEGSATFTATYKNNPVSLTVNAYRPEIAVEKNVILERKDGSGTGAIALDFTEFTVNDKTLVIEGTVKGATVAGAEVYSAFDPETDTLAFERNGLVASRDEMGKALAFKVETDKATYVLTAEVYTEVIENKEELYAFGTSMPTDGYYILGADIDDASAYPAAGDYGWTFNGIFDGRGHEIRDFNPGGSGFICRMGNDGILRNVSFLNAVQDTFWARDPAIINLGGTGTFENLYIHVKWMYAAGKNFDNGTKGRAGIFNVTPAAGGLPKKIKNVMVVVDEVRTSNADNTSAVGTATVIGYVDLNNGILDNLYVVGPDNLSVTASSWDAGQTPDVVGKYASIDALIAANNDYNAFKGVGFWQITSDGIPYPASMKYVRNVTSNKGGEVVTVDGAETYTVDIGDVTVKGMLDSVTVGGKAVNTFSYADGKLTLNLAEAGGVKIFGEQAVVATFVSGEDTLAVTSKVLFITKKIATAAEFNNIATWAKQVSGTNDYNGYFVLTADLDFESDNSKYDSEISTTTNVFYGTIDGRGHSIKNLSIATGKLDQYFIKALGTGAVVKNLAFVNAFCGTDGHGGDTFFASWKSGVYSVENVYIDLKFASIGWGVNAFGAPIGGFKAKNVVVKIADNVPKAYFSAQLCTADGYIDGVYFVTGAATKALSQGYKAPGGANASALNGNWTYGVYASDEEMKAANNDYSAFESEDFWKITSDGLPYPANLKYVRSVTSNKGGEVETATAETYTVDISDVTVNGNLTAVTVGGNAVTTFAYADGKLTLNLAEAGGVKIFGEKTVVATFDSGAESLGVTAKVLFITKKIATVTDMNAMGTYAAAAAGTSDRYDGYFILTADLDFESDGLKYTNAISNGAGNAFYGTIDGRGHTIKNLYITTDAVAGIGAWNRYFIGKFGAGATVKNIAFTNARCGNEEGKSSGDTFFTASAGDMYNLENIYMELSVGASWGRYAFGASAANGFKAKNVIVKMLNTTATTGCSAFTSNMVVTDGYLQGVYFVCSASDAKLAGSYKWAGGANATAPDSKLAALYASDAAMKEAGNDYSTFTASGYWTIVDGLPVFGAPAEA